MSKYIEPLEVRGRESMRAGRFYTYLHRRAADGRVFYVGKGRAGRACVTSGRGTHWTNVASKHGLIVEIIAPWPTEREAFDHEILLISVFREMGHPIVNSTSGGEGASGFRPGQETRAKMAAATARRWADPSAAEILSKAIRKAKQEPAAAAAHAAAMRRHRGSPEARARTSELQRAAWANPEIAAARKAAMAAAFARTEVRATWSAASKKKMQQPETKAKIVANLLAKNARSSVPVVFLDTGEICASIVEAARIAGVNQASLREACARIGGKTGGRPVKFLRDAIGPLQPDSGRPSSV